MTARNGHKVLLLLCLAIFLSACSRSGPEADNFNFTFKYGVMYKNELDTFNDIYTKDLVMDGVTTTTLKLSREDRQRIYECMTEIDIRDYRGVQQGLFFMPQSGFQFEIQMNEEKISIDWIGGFREDPKDQNFKRLVTLIQEIIESKDEYRDLPEANGYYL
ncbi:hypothetical protein ACF3MZ_23405 [Paenibacillaceae bacterium WGS1546]|uniref:hypothetical protein n=1 Tax=Cohnella sp. WGS1546 TaxID=3366810 RepID=UPI00372D179C